MKKSAPNRYLAPFLIAGVTVGFFVAAYKFVFSKPKVQSVTQPEATENNRAAAESDTEHTG